MAAMANPPRNRGEEMSMRFASVVGVGISWLGFVHAANAAFVTPEQWTRPTSEAEAVAGRTTYQEWNVFASPGGPNDPDVAEWNPNAGAGPNAGKANLFDSSGASFVTGGGNIYSPSAALALDADVPSFGLGAEYRTTVLFQVRSLGSELDYDTVRLTYADGGGTSQTISADSRRELARVQLGGFGGAQVDTLFAFEVPFSPASFKIEFDGAESSVSLDAVAVDTLTSVVPEPGALALGFGGAALLMARSRRPRRRLPD